MTPPDAPPRASLLSSLRAMARQHAPAPVLAAWQRWHLHRQRPAAWREYAAAMAGRQGLEVGGPSAVFRDALPVYPVLAGLDGLNFANHTMWEGALQAGAAFTYLPGRSGRQFIAGASELQGLPDAGYQALLSSNCLEHVANPIKALHAWMRVLEPGSPLLLVLPDPATNFDHRRPVTAWDHLLDDERREVGEDDLSHLEEILALHDLARDPWAGGRENFERRCHDNLRLRGLHHHVFDPALIDQMTRHVGLQTLRTDRTATDFVALCRKPRP